MSEILNDKELSMKLDPTGKIITHWTIRKWRLEGNLPHFRVGKRVFFRLDSVLAWMDEREQASTKHETAPESEYGKLRAVK